jgi:1,2-diacylglycerol 3-alpha-glucosyltransferase
MLKNNVIISVVHNGIDVSKKNDKQVREIYDELKIDKNKKIIATICRIDSNKRVDIFIDALNELSKSRNDLTGIIVGESGDPDLLKSLQVNAAKSKVPIHFTGFMSHESILNLYNLIDLLMINSDSETFSMVTLEAMSKKCLVLARQVGGVNDIITDNNNGFFYDYSADIKTIAEKIDYVLNLNNNDRNQIKKNALEIIEKNFQQKNKVEKVNKIFSDLLGS